jgi:hypothetical protein
MSDVSAISRIVFGASGKYQRALEHLNVLDQEIKWFNEGGPCHFAPKFDNQKLEHSIVIERLAEIPVKWPHIVGDCIQDFRNCLDHLVAEIVRLRHCSDEQTAFPICSDPIRFANTDRLKGAPKGARDVIEAMQPYQAGYGEHCIGDVSYFPFEPSYLWILHELSNVDKHRTIFLFRFRAKESAQFYRADGSTIAFAESIPVEELVEGTPIQTFTEDEFARLNPKMHMDFKLTIDIAFQEIEPISQGTRDLGITIGGLPVMETLLTIAHTIHEGIEALSPWMRDPTLG